MKKYNHKKAEKKRTDSGITLIEILVSIVLLGIIAAFVALAIPTSVSLTGRTNKMETTAVLAQKYIEDVKSAFGSDPTLFNDIEEGTTPPITIDEKKHTNDGQYQITTSLSINN
ncbi:MAG: type II secretion system protein [Vampirovibrionia bacterium]